jgi:predicted exporter
LSKSKLLAWVWVLVVTLLVAHNAYLWLGKRIVPDTDILALLPVQDRDPVLQQAFTHMVDSAQQRLIVLIGAENWGEAGRAADAYYKALAQHSDLFQFIDPVTDQTELDWLALFQQHRLTLLTSQNEMALRGQPQQFWVETAMSKLYSPFAGFKVGAWRDDPFGLFGDWVQARARETPVRPRDGRLFVSDERRQYVVLPITLRVPAFSMAAQQAVMPSLEQARQSATTAVPQIEVLAAGVMLHAAAASEQARQEMSTIGIGSAIGILALMWLSFHSLKPIALILLSIGIGCLGALSVCWLLFDRIHLLTLVFGASLIGVAEDYGIYFLCNRIGADAQLDSRQLLRRLLPGLVLTVVTTIAAYASLLLTPFPVLRQMAVFSIVGLVFAWLTVVLWFPILVRSGSITRTRLAQWCGTSLSHWPLLHRNRSTLAVIVLFIAMTAFGLSRLSANDDIRLLQNPPKNLLDDQIKISKLLDAPSPVQFYIVRGSTPEMVLQREEMLKQRLDPLIGKQIITGYHAISNWVPSLQAQTARRTLVEQTLLNESGPLKILAVHLGEDDQWIGATRDHLLASGSALTPDDFLKTSASEPWRYLWLGQGSGGYASVVALRGLNYHGIAVLRDAALGFDGVQWVDKVEEISSVLGGYRKYMSWVVVVAYLAVYALLYPRYRRAAWRLIAPTAVASVFALAVVGMTGQKLQLFHVLALMLLLGIGVDYSIFLHERPTRVHYTAWLAVGLSAASTLLSFGLLGLSKTPALQAFGFTLLIGIAAAWLIVPCFGKKRILREDTEENLVVDGAARRRA